MTMVQSWDWSEVLTVQISLHNIRRINFELKSNKFIPKGRKYDKFVTPIGSIETKTFVIIFDWNGGHRKPTKH